MPDRVPPALRPGKTDDVLESDRLTNIIKWGFRLALLFALFLPFYWFREPGRMSATEDKFAHESIARGKEYFALRTDPVTGEENQKGKECARCHGVKAQGGQNDYLNPDTGTRSLVQVPELQTVFARYKEPPPGYQDARAFIHETIERGRPGTDMPTWGTKYGGPLTDQEIDDIINWLQTIQKTSASEKGASPESIFTKNCSPCHGIGGSGGIGPSMKNGSETRQFPNIDDHIKFVKEGSKPGQRYGTSGVGTGRMPPWQGRLTDDQIRSVIEYERGL